MTRPARCAAALVGAFLLSASLAACSAALPSDGPLAVHPKPNAGMDALLQGTLQLEDDCVVVEFDQPEPVMPSFPAGDATFDDGVLTWRGDDYRMGDPIALGGGFASTSGGYRPAGCAGLEAFIVSPFQ